MSEVMLTLTRDTSVITLELFENDIPTLNKFFDDIETLKTRGEFSQTFRVPFTDNNAAFFGNIADPNYLGFDFKTKITASISVSTIPIATGYCQVKNIIKKSDAHSEIELVFFSDARNLAAAIGDKKLADIVALPDLNHDMTRANVENPPANTLWTLIEKGARFSEAGEPNTRRITDLNNPLYVGELTPAVNWKWIFENILKDAGFVYEGATLDAILERYWMPFVNRQTVATTDNVDNTLFAIDTPSDYLFNALPQAIVNITQDAAMAETFDNGNNVSAGVFTAPFTGVYTFRFVLQIKKTTVPANQSYGYSFFLNKSGVGPLTAVSGQTYMTVIVGTSNTFNTGTYERSYFLNTGDIVDLRLLMPFALGGGTEHTLGSETGWQLVTTSTAFQGSEVNLPLNAPDVKQIDFVRDVIRMHCLNISPDTNIPNLLYCEPFTDYIGSGQTHNYTKKIDYTGTRDVVIRPTTDIQNRNLTFTYKAGGEYLSDLYVKQGGRVYGERRIDNTENDFATGDLKIELETRSTPSNEVNGTNIPIPKFVNEAGVFVSPFMRVLFNAGTAMLAIYDDATTVGVMTEVPILNNFSALNPDVTDDDLNWAAETPVQFITAIPYNNLFNSYWAAYYNELYSDESRIMEAYFNLSTTDYFGLKGSDRLLIKDGYWRVLEISGFEIGSSEPTKMKLAKIVNVQPDCLYTPVAITLRRQVLFNGNGETNVAGDQTCCERYGYEWNAEKGECFALPTGRNNFLNNPQTISEALVSFERGTNNVNEGSELVTISGDNNFIGAGDNASQINGYQNRIEANTGISQVTGVNVHARQQGLHFGAGEALGESQAGVLHFRGTGAFNSTGDEIELFVNSQRLRLLDKTAWGCEIVVSLIDDANQAHSAVFGFLIYKDGTAEASAVTTIAEHGAIHSIDLIIDTTTNTAEHRLLIRAQGGGGYPFTGIVVSAFLEYAQVKK